MLKQEPAVHVIAAGSSQSPTSSSRNSTLLSPRAAVSWRARSSLILSMSTPVTAPGDDQPGDFHRDLAACAAQIDAAHPRRQARPGEQRRGAGPSFARQQQEAFVTLFAAPDHIPLHPGDPSGHDLRSRWITRRADLPAGPPGRLPPRRGQRAGAWRQRLRHRRRRSRRVHPRERLHPTPGHPAFPYLSAPQPADLPPLADYFRSPQAPAQ